MEVHEKLRHLTDKQIYEIINMYKDKNVKIKDIIDKYDIDVKSSGFLKILPPVKTNLSCIHCSEKLYQNIERRTSYGYSESEKKCFCINCGHMENSKRWGEIEVCYCDGCTKYREKILSEKKNKIKDVYDKNYEKLEFEAMEFQDQINLISVMINNPKYNTLIIGPLEIYDLYKKDRWISKINKLLEIGAIAVSPDSKVEAFNESDFPYTAFLHKATYKINVSFQDKTIDLINKNKFFAEHVDSEDKLVVLKQLIYEDAINQFSIMLTERKLELYISENANTKFTELIDKISYTQLLYQCLKVAQFFGDGVLTGKIYKKVACNGALLNVSKFYENAIRLSWTLKNLDYEQAGDELRFYVEKVLRRPLSLLKEVASIKTLESFPDIENDYSKETRSFYN